MSTITLTIAKPAQGSLGKAFAWIARAVAAHRDRAAFAGMSEREFQDVGWGQLDRYPHALAEPETPPERQARLVARAAWYSEPRRAA